MPTNTMHGGRGPAKEPPDCDDVANILQDHHQRIERLEAAQETMKMTLAELRQDLRAMRDSITRQLNNTMLMILASVLLYVVAQLLGLSGHIG